MEGGGGLKGFEEMARVFTDKEGIKGILQYSNRFKWIWWNLKGF